MGGVLCSTWNDNYYIGTIHYIMGSNAIEFDLTLACIYHVYTDKGNYVFQFSEVIYPCMISDS